MYTRYMSTSLKSYLFVCGQFALIAAIVLIPGTPTSQVQQMLGLVLLCGGLGLCITAIWQLRRYSLTALPTPIKDAKLLNTGLYTTIRHPIYTGLIMTMMGVVSARYSVVRFILLLLLITLLYQKSKFEEQQLIATFGKRYKEYMKTTRRFL